MGQCERRNNPIIFSFFFNKPSNQKKEPMVTLKNNRFVLWHKMCRFYASYLFATFG